MSSQISLLPNTDPELTTTRHINHEISGLSGLQNVSDVPGLKLIEEFLTPEEQADCVKRVDAAATEWRNDLSRRVQHYGWRYDYKARAITPDMHIGVLPDWLTRLAQKLYDETGLFDRVPEQVIVNEYQPGQGIAMHIDHPGLAQRSALYRYWMTGDGLCETLEGQGPCPVAPRFVRIAD